MKLPRVQHEIADVALTMMEDLDAELQGFEALGDDSAQKKNEMHKAKAKAFLRSEGKNAVERESQADYMWADERLASDLASNRREASLEKIRSLRQQLSVLQSIMSVRKSEADAIHYGQSTT